MFLRGDLLVRGSALNIRFIRSISSNAVQPPIFRHKMSALFVPTMKEKPADTVLVSHELMIRAGLMRQISSGHYTLLPLLMRVMKKLEHIIDYELQRVDCQRLDMPMMLPAPLWQKTERWDAAGPELFRLKDRKGMDHCMAPTHEEPFTQLVSQHVSSWKQLPLRLYQINRKFRDEVRPRFGLMRSREFVMKDLYSFDVDVDTALSTYATIVDTYHRIFSHFQVPFVQVEADSGSIGGSYSHEFHILSQAGEDVLLVCNNTACSYAANIERAQASLPSSAASSFASSCIADALPPSLASLLSRQSSSSSSCSTAAESSVRAKWEWTPAQFQHWLQAMLGRHQKEMTGPKGRIDMLIVSRVPLRAGTSAALSYPKLPVRAKMPAEQITVFVVPHSRQVNWTKVRADFGLSEEDRLYSYVLGENLVTTEKMPESLSIADLVSLLNPLPSSSVPSLFSRILICYDSNTLNSVVSGQQLEKHRGHPADGTEQRQAETPPHVKLLEGPVLHAEATVAHCMLAQAGDLCVVCNNAESQGERKTMERGMLVQHRGIEIGHCFYLGTKYSAPFSARFRKQDTAQDKEEKETGKELTPLIEMGCYGIGVTRIVAGVIEAGAAAAGSGSGGAASSEGIVWPPALAPYRLSILAMDKRDTAGGSAALRLYDALQSLSRPPGLKDRVDLSGTGEGGRGGEYSWLANEVVLDERDEVSAGAKLKDAKLIGFPLLCVLGKAYRTEGLFEFMFPVRFASLHPLLMSSGSSSSPSSSNPAISTGTATVFLTEQQLLAVLGSLGPSFPSFQL